MEQIKILIPTDFSVQAEYAYLMVKKLAEKIPVNIHFLHVMNVPDTVYLDTDDKIKTCGEIDIRYVEKQKEIAERKLNDLKLQYGNSLETHLELGKTTAKILEFSKAGQYDLIVMGTKGAYGIKEKFSGSETQIIARKTRIPLLSLMCDRSDLQINNILFVHNFDQPQKENLQLLQKLFNSFGTRIHFLQIVTIENNHEFDRVKQNMQKFAELNDIKNFDCHIMQGKDVENGVVHFSQKLNMDMVCIGTHGKGSIFHHSVTEKLINHLFKPIISFHLNN